MNLTLIPLLIVALMLATTEGDADAVELLLDGTHRIDDNRDAVIVGDARVVIPADASVQGPVYVIGGELVVAGSVATDVVQLAGTVTIEPGAVVVDELRHLGGTQSVAADADVGRRTSFQVNATRGNPTTTIVFNGILTLFLAWIGARLTRNRRRLLENVGEAVSDHYVVSLTVGTLLALTAVAMFAFMASTLILIPVALVGVLAGVLTLAYGIIVWGHIIGTRLPLDRPGLASGIGVALAVVAVQLTAAVPVVGTPLVFAFLLSAVGAIAITYYGVAPFRPATLPDERLDELRTVPTDQ